MKVDRVSFQDEVNDHYAYDVSHNNVEEIEWHEENNVTVRLVDRSIFVTKQNIKAITIDRGDSHE